MARIRSIKPEFPQSESMGRISRDSRLLFVELWTICDDSGRTRGNSRMLASLLFPYDNDAPLLIDGWIAELEREGCIVRYVAEGSTYIEVRNWLNHQKIDKPSQSKIPAFNEASRILANDLEASITLPVGVDQGVDQGEEKDKTVAAKNTPRFDPLAHLLELGIDQQTAADWLKLRKTKRADSTLTAINGVVSEAEKAGVSLQSAIAQCCKRGWVGFEAEWLKKSNLATSQPKRPTIHDERAYTSAALTGKIPASTTLDEFMAGASGNKALIEGEVRRVA